MSSSSETDILTRENIVNDAANAVQQLYHKIPGGLFAGATAGGNVRAEAGLAGGVNAGKSAGSGYAAAQAGDHIASSGLVGDRQEAKIKRLEEKLKRKELKKKIKQAERENREKY